jgi:DNA-binding response OmpR family regulator
MRIKNTLTGPTRRGSNPQRSMTGETASIAGPRPKVLVVEDDQASARAMRLLLEHYGFDVSLVTTTREAMELLPSNPVYVFLDLMLPDGDGARVLEELRRLGSPTKVAVITGTTDPDLLRRVKRLAPDMLLQKPLDFFQLLEKIRPPR